ncbi:FecR family protein [Pedobacter nyackensis]|uniref:FecR family protein n=1 Tax=Pedobacter nyackensis TaxID=475255 RepID=UPI00292EC5EE|nr:FecR domain-containing protein [Pedobacter nyackensis]
MNKEEATGLAKKFLEGKATSEEKKQLHGWSALTNDEEAEVVFTSEPENAEQVKSRLFERIQAKIDFDGSPVHYKNIGSRLWYRIATAAAILLVAGSSMYFYTTGTVGFFKDNLADGRNITAGKNTAVLTLANGRQIDLSAALNGQLVKEPGLSITKAADGQLVYEIKGRTGTAGDDGHLNTVSTPKGGQYKVVLPDGSKVWLNAASSISFPSVFSGLSHRKVQLNGEAYFEVKKDKSHPFVVQAGQQKIEVLGTHFNVNAYTDEHRIKTTLLEGSVRVGFVAPAQTVPVFGILKPGQQSILADGAMNIIPADTEEALAWKNGYFKFNSESISSIMRKLSRWYDVEVVYEGELSKDRFGGTISRNKNVADVLEMLESTKLVTFKVEGRKIIVK